MGKQQAKVKFFQKKKKKQYCLTKYRLVVLHFAEKECWDFEIGNWHYVLCKFLITAVSL